MDLIVIYILVCYGMANMIVYANGPFHIFRKLHSYLDREYPMLGEMISCMICLPTWIGFLMSAINIIFFTYSAFTPMNSVIFDKNLWPIIVFLDGMLTSGACWLIHTLQEMMERIGGNE